MVFAQRRIFSNRRASQGSRYGVRQPRIKLQKLKRGARRGIVKAMRLFVKGLLYEQSSSARRAKHMAKSHLKLVTPATVKRTVTPKRLPNADLRTREYLTEAEVERLMAAAKGNRWRPPGCDDGPRGLPARPTGRRTGRPALGAGRLRERLRCTSVGSSRAPPAPIRSSATNCGRCGDFSASRSPSHPSCSLRSGARPSPPLASPAWWSARAGWRSLAFKAHPHMLRHACGYALANKGHDTRALQAYLGHRNIQHTVRYTELSPTRFKDFWRS